jgi:hypothetical protein
MLLFSIYERGFIMKDYPTTQFLKDAFPYALGYWQGRSSGYFENGTYENMSDFHKHLYKLGYDSGVADYCELDDDCPKFEPAREEI